MAVFNKKNSLREDLPERHYSIDDVESSWRSLLPAGFKRIVGYDTETWKIVNGVVPKPVCYTFYDPSKAGVADDLTGDAKGYIFNAEDGAKHMKQLLLDDSVLIVAQNAAFDAAVVSVQDPELFALLTRAYKRGRVACTSIRQTMLTVADTWNAGEMERIVPLSAGNASINSLAGMVKIYFNRDISRSKTADSWRLRYKELDGVPVDTWDTEAVDYAIEDAHYAVLIYLAQQREAQTINNRVKQLQNSRHINVLGDANRQAYAAFVLHHMSSVHGIYINPNTIAQTRAAATAQHLKLLPELTKLGIYNAAPKTARGVKLHKASLQALYMDALTLVGADQDPAFFSAGYVGQVHKISTAAETRLALNQAILRVLKTGKNITSYATLSDTQKEQLEVLHTLINRVSDAESSWKEISTFVSAVERGSLNPDNRLRFSMNGLVATGRTSSKNPNLQNLPRGGGVRSCIEPQAGYVFLISDYSAAEFRTLGQINEDEAGAGTSEIARQYRANRSFDPHLYAAARMWEIEKHEAMPMDRATAIYSNEADPNYKPLKKMRQLAKIVNFGLAGGLTSNSLISYARGYNVELSLTESETLCSRWLQVWGEMGDYFNRRKRLFTTNPMGDYIDTNDDTRIYVFQRDNRARFCKGFTVSCNTPFQGMAASGCKEALISIFEECYFKKSSPLYGSYIVLMVHDEVVLESPYDGTAEGLQKLRAAAARFSELMVAGMEKFTPNVPAEATVAISTRWTKDAKEAVDENGELLVWSPSAEDEEDDEDDAPADLQTRFPSGYATVMVKLAQNLNLLASQKSGATDDDDDDDDNTPED